MDVRLFKLVTGEEVMGELVETTATSYIVKHAAIMAMMSDESERPQLVPVPLSPICQNPAQVEFQKIHVLLVLNPVPKLAEQFKMKHGGVVNPMKLSGGGIEIP